MQSIKCQSFLTLVFCGRGPSSVFGTPQTPLWYEIAVFKYILDFLRKR